MHTSQQSLNNDTEDNGSTMANNNPQINSIKGIIGSKNAQHQRLEQASLIQIGQIIAVDACFGNLSRGFSVLKPPSSYLETD